VRRRAGWSSRERRAFDGLALVAALVPDLAAWPARERRALVAILRAKGGGSEGRYTRLLDGHRRLRLRLEALVRAAR